MASSGTPSTSKSRFDKMMGKPGSTLVPVLLVLLSIISITWSAALAKQLFATLTPPGVTALRLFFSALILIVVMRPWRHPLPRPAWGAVVVYGGSLGCMNLCFYLAIDRLPLGIAVGLEFTGPLLLSLFASRSKGDIVWAGLAIMGVATLVFGKALAAGQTTSVTSLDPVGLLFIALASLCWTLYIVFGKKSGQLAGPTTVVYAMCVAAIFTVPIGFSQAGMALFSLSIVPLAFALGLFSSALPYALEIVALEKLPTRTFGILMSLEPAFAAFSGFMFLHEQLSLTQWLALGSIVLASVGSTVSSRK